ncbi:MAG TPA: YXWGXW repeat-containing protein [Bryobacteraceae bacterium]|jgi:hypothetical protein|nr:YXWGXW repeat-containing protein [Bryobacteraceae bacterium]
MKTKLLAVILLGAGLACAQISIGIRIGPPPQPRVLRVQPKSPGAGYVWVAGYWYPVGSRYTWHAGYWTRPPYEGAHWVAPHHDGQQYFAGTWDGDRGQVAHDHTWDKDNTHSRDFNRGGDQNHR